MKKTKNLPILLAIAATIAILMSACCKDDTCKDGKLTQREVSITGEILGIIVEGPWNVTITQDSTNNSAMLEYCASVENKIKAELRSNGYLHIKISSVGTSHCKTLRANINATTLEHIKAAGAATIRTSGHFYSVGEITLSGASTVNRLSCNGDYAKLTLSGASTLKSFTFNGIGIDANLSGASNATLNNVNIDYCKVNSSGASTFNGSGYATKAIFTGSGASTFKTLNLISENLDIDLSGASIADITVNNSIRGRLTGASVLKYRNATNVNVDVSGGSKLTRID